MNMMMVFGPAGSGKTTQARRFAEMFGGRAMSVGEICRERFHKYTETGAMVPEGELAKVVVEEVDKSEVSPILDGQPWTEEGVREMEKSGWMERIKMAIVLEVPREECLRRLAGRGREDDDEAVWKRKLDMYEERIGPFLEGLEKNGVAILKVNGVGTEEEVFSELIRSFAKMARENGGEQS